jgi:hypothetical protein
MSGSSTAIIATIGGAAVKTLMNGGVPDASTWGSVATALIDAVLSSEDRSMNVLGRIETKIDQQRDLAYLAPLRAATHHLRDAKALHRTEADRERMLEQARVSLVDAIAAAPDRLAAARGQWCLGVVRLAAKDPEDSRTAMRRAADEAARAMLDALGEYREPSERDVGELASRYRTTLNRFGVGSGEPEHKARSEIRDRAWDRIVTALEVLKVIQRERLALGVSAGECHVPTLDESPFRRYAPILLVRSVPGLNVVGDLSVEIHDSYNWTGPRGAPLNVIDVDLMVHANSEGPSLVVGLKPLHQLRVDDSNLVGPGRPGLTPTDVAEPLPGKGIMAGGAVQARGDRLRVDAGRRYRGWLRLACPPTRVSGHRADHESAAPIVGIRVAFRPDGPGHPGFGVDAGAGTIDILVRHPQFIPQYVLGRSGSGRFHPKDRVLVQPLRPRIRRRTGP